MLAVAYGHNLFDWLNLEPNAVCPSDITSYRTDAVVNSFDPAMLDGVWYEHAFIDAAQIGASC